MDLKQHLLRQIAFSEKTFGPGPRSEGIIDHVRKELEEIKGAPFHSMKAAEWVDVAILALDGLWREIRECDPEFYANDELVALDACAMIEAKQSKNEDRKWPDWRTAEPGKAIEHVRDDE